MEIFKTKDIPCSRCCKSIREIETKYYPIWYLDSDKVICEACYNDIMAKAELPSWDEISEIEIESCSVCPLYKKKYFYSDIGALYKIEQFCIKSIWDKESGKYLCPLPFTLKAQDVTKCFDCLLCSVKIKMAPGFETTGDVQEITYACLLSSRRVYASQKAGESIDCVFSHKTEINFKRNNQ